MSQSPEDPKQPRSRFGELMYKIFGPAQVEGAIQGHSPEARESWKRRLAERKKDRGTGQR